MLNRTSDVIYNETYLAPSPHPPLTSWTLFKKIAIRVLFPPLLLWESLQFGVNFIWGRAAGRRVLAAQRIHFRLPLDTNQSLEHLAGPGSGLSYHKISVHTHDQAHLDSIEINHHDAAFTPAAEKRYIVHFTGNSDCYERNYRHMCTDAAEHKCSVVGFNFRGVRNSRGIPQRSKDLITDGIAQIQRLLDQGIKPHHITLKGHSLGGAVATLVTKHFHDKGIGVFTEISPGRAPNHRKNFNGVRVFNDRSFSSLTDVLIGNLRTLGADRRTGHTETWYGIALGWMAWPFLKIAFYLVDWEMDAAAAFKKLPDEAKEYTVVRPHRDDRQNGWIGDPKITSWASMHRALKSERKEKKATLKKAIHLLENLPARSTAQDAQLSELRHQLSRFKNRKIAGGEIPEGERPHYFHNTEIRNLTIRPSWGALEETGAHSVFTRFLNGTSSLAVQSGDNLDFRPRR